MAKKFYVVWSGRQTGIFTDWPTAQRSVEKYSGACFKSFPTRVEAEQAFARRGDTTHVVMERLEFMERLAALVPRPRLHLIRFHGVLAPNAKLRSKIVPAPAPPATESPSEDAHGQGAPERISWARLLKRVFAVDVETLSQLRRCLEDYRRHR